MKRKRRKERANRQKKRVEDEEENFITKCNDALILGRL